MAVHFLLVISILNLRVSDGHVLVISKYKERSFAESGNKSSHQMSWNLFAPFVFLRKMILLGISIRKRFTFYFG